MKIIARKSYFFVYLSAFIACCCFISFVAQGASNIVAINSPIELEKIIMQKADQSALFVFDIDDTLIASSKPILRANALNKLINSTTQKYACSIKEVIGLIELKLHTAHDHLGSGSPVSTGLIRSIQNLLKQKMRIIALTNVDSGPIIINIPTLKISKKLNVTYEDRRFKDLKTIGLDFSNSFVEKILYLYDDLNSKSKPIYKNGIIVSSGSSKGDVLVKFLSLVSWKPKKIIFVDNYLYNVESVGDALKNLDISFEGIYFTFVNDESDKYSEQKIDATSNCLMNFEAQLEQCIFNE